MKLTCLTALVLTDHSASALDYYVSGKGCDGNSGLNPEEPFRSLQVAADLTQPGDTVYIMDGEYTEAEGKERVLTIRSSGEKDNWITYRAYPGHRPVIRFKSWAGVEIQGASFIEINGLNVIGSADQISLDYARQEMSNLGNGSTSGNGIFVRGEPLEERISSHIRIINNRVANAPGGGIGAMHADYITISGNTVEGCAFYAPYANSGISIYQAIDTDEFKGYKIIITGNVSRNNINYIPFYFSHADPDQREFTDGNGIIVDDLKGSQDFVGAPLSEPYGGRTLIANNICYGNGGSGIHAFKSRNVDIVHNTAYLNGKHPQMETGQIFANTSEEITIANNILWALPGEKINDNYRNNGVQYLNNLFFDGSECPNVLVEGRNTVIGDPLFAPDPQTPEAFHPLVGSPCIDKGIRLPLHDSEHLKTDALGLIRVSGKGPDIGAIEVIQPGSGSDQNPL